VVGDITTDACYDGRVLEVVFGSKTAERVLLYLHNYEEGYALGIAKVFACALNGVQKQLRRLEVGGVLVSRLVGRTRVYTWNPRYPFRTPLRGLLAAAFELMPESDIKAYYRARRRPRRSGKPM
jgi:hypothetical protein